MKIPVVTDLANDAADKAVGYLELDAELLRQMGAGYLNGGGWKLHASVLFSDEYAIVRKVSIVPTPRVAKSEALAKPEPPKIAMPVEPIGFEPRLKVGDVVKVDEVIGVVIHAFMHPNAPPNYDIVFPDVGLKRTGWKMTEIDEVVSFGPFHGK